MIMNFLISTLTAACIIYVSYFNQSARAQSMKPNWIEQMVRDVEQASSDAQSKRLDWKKRSAERSSAAQNHFPPGMPLPQAEQKLIEMKNNGFTVTEYTRDGSRDWPNGVLRPYPDEGTKKTMNNQIHAGTRKLIATKKWRSRLIVEEFFSVELSISEEEKKVTLVEANRSATSL